MAYDVFISYSSTDGEWAEKLFGDLERKQFVPFLDRKRLVVGDVWDEGLIEALRNSRHLIVLWSEHASQSKWVTEEYTRFNQISRDFERQSRVITILLEGENRRFSSYQVIKDLQRNDVYRAGFEQLDENVWQEVMDKVNGALEVDDTSTPIPLAIIATTRERLKNEVNPDEGPALGMESLQNLLTRLRLGTKDDLLRYYGDTCKDWRPFGGDAGENIMTIMNNLRDEINLRNPDDRIRWKPIDDVFWSTEPEDAEKVEQEAEKFLPLESDPRGLSVIVIDPVSFYDKLVEYRFSRHIYKCLSNGKCLVMVLPPFPIPELNAGLRFCLKERLSQVYNYFYFPIEKPIAAANCNLYISEHLDIKRFVVWALKSQIQRKELANLSTPFTRIGV
ncbi:MAG TPA: toll/interleukin-1 receptor domain-containing protein [Ktedonobacteraceae bacterium]|nr:toll/interleukin-1 receptor domain-containing protein [Ktedonobacteraceae bacterium]